MSIYEEIVILGSEGTPKCILTRDEALKLRDLLNQRFAGQNTPVEPARPKAPEPVKPPESVELVNQPVVLRDPRRKAEAVKEALETGDKGPSAIRDILEEKGVPISMPALTAILRNDGRFINIKHGLWGLKTAEAASSPGLLPQIEELMGSEPWTLEALAGYFQVTPDKIKETLMFPGTRFYQVEEGMMQLKPQFHEHTD